MRFELKIIILLSQCLILVSILCYVILELKSQTELARDAGQVLLETKSIQEHQPDAPYYNTGIPPIVGKEQEGKDSGSDPNSSPSPSPNIFDSFNSLPDFIKVFQSEQETNFSRHCRDYWRESVSYLISKYKRKEPPETGPSMLTEEILEHLSGTTSNEDNTMIKIRIKYRLDPETGRILHFEPAVSCISDKRVPKPSQSRLKIRDINHTLRYAFKAIKRLNEEIQQSETTNQNPSLILLSERENKGTTPKSHNIRYLDVLMHYDDCPIIWRSIPLHIYRNDTLHLEKCILNSKFSKKMQLLFSNSTEIRQVLLPRPTTINAGGSCSSPFCSIFSPNNSSLLTSYSLSFKKKKEPPPPSPLPSSPAPNLQRSQNNDETGPPPTTETHHTLTLLHPEPNTNDNEAVITSSLIHQDAPPSTTKAACNVINQFVNQVVASYNPPHPPPAGVSCRGTIQCYIPCFFEDSPVFPSILDKLKKKDPSKLFSHIHCICKFKASPKSPPPGLILSISSHQDSWDLASIPYANHLDSNELFARSLVSSGSTWNLNQSNNTLFFVGRYTDTDRLDLSCDIYNLIPRNPPGRISNRVFVSDSNKISCENRARLLEKLTLCDSNFICRKEPTSFREWISEAISSKFSLDLSGVGPWSNRLRLLMLSGTMILQNVRSYNSQQFYDLLLKKNNLFFKFNSPDHILSNINMIMENPQISSNVSRIVSNFALHCLSEDGIILYLETLLLQLGLWDLASHSQRDYSPPHIQNVTETQFLPKDDLETIKSKVKACLAY